MSNPCARSTNTTRAAIRLMEEYQVPYVAVNNSSPPLQSARFIVAYGGPNADTTIVDSVWKGITSS